MSKLSKSESEKILHKMLDAEEGFRRFYSGGKISLTATQEFFDACAMALKALEDIDVISKALCDITEKECCSYGYDAACDKAEKWYPHVTRQSIIRTQLEEIMEGFDNPVSYDELIKAIQEMKGDDT